MNDHDLKKRVEAELEWNPAIETSQIGVAVDKSVVTLSGAVRSYPEKLALERTVMSVKGVAGLAQEVHVRPFGDSGVDDDEIAKRAIRALEWDVMVPNDRIQVRVESGLVTLTGEVDWQFQRDAAERAIRNLYGVIGFNDQIRLTARAKVADIRLRIEDALDRQASIDASRVKVSVEGGKVHLTGKYASWSERDAIERAAWSAPGVSSIDDRMTMAI